jgi:uncharacterized protein YkwD
MINKLVLFLFLLLPLLSFSQLTDKEKGTLRTELAERINQLRESKSLEPLLFNDVLQKAADFHSEYMAKIDVLSHDQKQAKYTTPKDRVIAFEGKEFELVGENVLYSTAQEFPMKKKSLIDLADEMFLTWKNSPGHYANMTNTEYVFGDLGFAVNKTKNIVFATQVFGTKGEIVSGQLSKNAYGLKKASRDCEKEYDQYSNLILNMGNNLEIAGNEVIMYYHNINYFNSIFSGPEDGVAIDLVHEDQFLCGKANQLDFSPVYDGILLKPYYSAQMLANNTAESEFRVITKVADIPDQLLDKGYTPSLVLIKNGKACKYIYPAFVPRQNYKLRPIDPKTKDEPVVEFLEKGIVRTQIVDYDFKTNITKALDLPKIITYENEVYSVQVNSFSSVEGDSLNNAKLHNGRADFIKNHLRSVLAFPADSFVMNAKENWDEMIFQLNYFEQDELANLSHDSLKKVLTRRDKSIPWDSLLFEQRTATAIINYFGEYVESDTTETLAEFNLRTAVATKNAPLANKALYEMYHVGYYNPFILFEPQILEFIKSEPRTVANFSALLSNDFQYDPYIVTDFIYSWLNKYNQLNNDAHSNLLHLYTLVGSHLLDNWDVSSERLSNVIHPTKIEKMGAKNEKAELVLNLHLTFLQYFGQVNDQNNINKSFDFIADYFKKNRLKPEEDVALALFFNYWSMYDMAVEHLFTRFEADQLNEDGLFVLAETMNFTNYEDQIGHYVDVQKQAIKIDQERWCAWLKSDFQVKRNPEVKRLYCESCE